MHAVDVVGGRRRLRLLGVAEVTRGDRRLKVVAVVLAIGGWRTFTKVRLLRASDGGSFCAAAKTRWGTAV